MARHTWALLLGTLAAITAVAFVACGDDDDDANGDDSASPTVSSTEASPDGDASRELRVSSDAFSEGEPIPVEYSCDGDNTSPPVAWTGAPEGTAAFALVMDDPDAPVGTFDHWVLYNVPPETTSLPAAVPAQEQLEGGALHGVNGAGRIGYLGPCPPEGDGAHRYQFRVFALDEPVDLASGASKTDLENAIDGHVLASGQLTGLFER